MVVHLAFEDSFTLHVGLVPAHPLEAPCTFLIVVSPEDIHVPASFIGRYSGEVRGSRWYCGTAGVSPSVCGL